MDRVMATGILNRPARLRAVLAVTLVAGLAGALGTADLSKASAEAPTCTLTAPARLPVDRPYLEFEATRSCTSDAPSEVTWTATAGSTQITELWFLQRTKASGDVYADDPLGPWTWKVTEPVDRPDVMFNEPVTDVRAKSTAVGTGVWNAVDGTTKVTFHVERYDPATNKMVPWAGAVGTTEYHDSPLIGDPPFTKGQTYTTNSNGDVVITIAGSRFDRVFRIVMADASVVFGSRSNSVLVRAARIFPTR
jgi:hypothetical protein